MTGRTQAWYAAPVVRRMHGLDEEVQSPVERVLAGNSPEAIRRDAARLERFAHRFLAKLGDEDGAAVVRGFAADFVGVAERKEKREG